MDLDTQEELKEASTLLGSAKGPRVRAALSALVATLEVTGSRAEATPAESASTIAKPATSASAPEKDVKSTYVDTVNGSSVKVAVKPPSPVRVPTQQEAVPKAGGVKYSAFDTFAWDQGAYSSGKVTVYVPLEGVGKAKDTVACSFTNRGFDLTVTNMAGKSYRLVQNNLEKDILPDQSTFLVKRDKILVKLAKVKAEYGSYDHWNSLSAKKPRSTKKSDPSTDIMDMMKNMYDEGDDNMKKVIGEAMMKSRNNPTPSKPSFDSSPSHGGDSAFGGGMGNFDDFDDDLDGGNDSSKAGKDDWGLGKDDFGFGQKTPPPEANEPLPETSDDHKQGDLGAGTGKPAQAEVPETGSAATDVGAEEMKGEPAVDSMEVLDN